MAPLLFLTGCNSATVKAPFGIAAGPRVVEPGQKVSKDGGQDKPGKPYKVAGKGTTPDERPENYSAEGLASWYGAAFDGRATANGEIFDKGALSAAHPSLPLPSYARVTNVNNGRSIVVRVNDRGPFHGDRTVDVSEKVAEILGFRSHGLARVRVDYVGPASLKGSDSGQLMATYREEGRPGIALAGLNTPAAVPAEPTPASRVASSFTGFSNPQPLAQHGGMVQPVLSGYAFGPPSLRTLY